MITVISRVLVSIMKNRPTDVSFWKELAAFHYKLSIFTENMFSENRDALLNIIKMKPQAGTFSL